MKLSIPDAAKVIYEARRATKVASYTDEDGVVIGLDVGAPFGELSGEERESLFAEVQANRQSGEPMQDAIGQAIEDALK